MKGGGSPMAFATQVLKQALYGCRDEQAEKHTYGNSRAQQHPLERHHATLRGRPGLRGMGASGITLGNGSAGVGQSTGSAIAFQAGSAPSATTKSLTASTH